MEVDTYRLFVKFHWWPLRIVYDALSTISTFDDITLLCTGRLKLLDCSTCSIQMDWSYCYIGHIEECKLAGVTSFGCIVDRVCPIPSRVLLINMMINATWTGVVETLVADTDWAALPGDNTRPIVLLLAGVFMHPSVDLFQKVDEAANKVYYNRLFQNMFIKGCFFVSFD